MVEKGKRLHWPGYGNVGAKVGSKYRSRMHGKEMSSTANVAEELDYNHVAARFNGPTWSRSKWESESEGRLQILS
jgi:hypothetical protein